ncbi:MAG: putative quinol monooxygenase [Pseudomonadales bacterium]|jgi:quinol monooxygenase YgiN|nr:putative quinol monooxygenase [Pseudomonadales bacterium]MDP7145280.1 putative quinol monooxygenase [Pseudomonadales bacterium]MDP7360171.1 putative quinol monooxygenase [Pseudomonadales bacterium]MDP7595667.1 putative quinol monooxygenase [Pseudomonadales bacterium]HJN51537.1 putative quinol monooxygenase [Pseudomonadales bacterium]|tara:strand:- start:9236 stop:9586 length:351 start_codon:yes stop_codon:yes gene_type:complete
MIIVHGTFPVKADLRDEALTLMRQMAVASQTEDGCISYEFYVGLSQPNSLLLFQEWESVEALQNHFETKHMAEFLKELPDVLDGEVSTRRYEVRVPGEVIDEPPVRRTGQAEKIIH